MLIPIYYLFSLGLGVSLADMGYSVTSPEYLTTNVLIIIVGYFLFYYKHK